MSDPLYKVAFHFPVPICDGSLALNSRTQTLQTAQQFIAWRKERDVRKWLRDNGHSPPLIVYNNCRSDSTRGEIVVVLSNRDTAMMLKLTLT